LIHLTRRYRFSASHRLHSDALTPERNREVYGKCDNPYGHGHNYTLEVTVAGSIDPALGRAADIPALDKTVRESVLRDLDHRNLNRDVPEFATGLVPTTETLAEAVRARLLRNWPADLPRLHRVRIFETRNNVFEIEERA
jgi:6-pyruvoyltetrahydropterin/6-carboxytetrahydropterin synthase